MAGAGRYMAKSLVGDRPAPAARLLHVDRGSFAGGAAEPHEHSHWQIEVILAGTVAATAGDARWRLARGQATFERRADNLIATLERIAADTGGSSAASFEQIESGATVWLDFHADNLFYSNKGRIYAYALLLEALGEDFAAVIRERNVQRNWEELVRTFMAAAILQPWVVSNGALDSMWRPNHLAAQGFLLLRARFQLYEVINVLTK